MNIRTDFLKGIPDSGPTREIPTPKLFQLLHSVHRNEKKGRDQPLLKHLCGSQSRIQGNNSINPYFKLYTEYNPCIWGMIRRSMSLGVSSNPWLYEQFSWTWKTMWDKSTTSTSKMSTTTLGRLISLSELRNVPETKGKPILAWKEPTSR